MKAKVIETGEIIDVVEKYGHLISYWDSDYPNADFEDVIYINQLYIAREELIKEERYEEADKISKIINEEIKRQKTE